MNDRRVIVTFWKSLTETHGIVRELSSWKQFFDRLSNPTNGHDERSMPGWSPVRFAPSERKSENVQEVFALVLDYDHEVTVADAKKLWGTYSGCVHTTKSHTPESPRCRVILPLSRTVTKNEYSVVWQWADALSRGRGLVPDRQTKDASRFWFMPSKTDDFEAVLLDGTELNPDEVLACYVATKQAPAEQSSSNGTTYRISDDVEMRASKYLARMDAAVAGQAGHEKLWAAVIRVHRGFGLSTSATKHLILSEYNSRCVPPWSEREIDHKISDAEKSTHLPFGFMLRDDHRSEWKSSSNGSSNGAVPDDFAAIEVEDKTWMQSLIYGIQDTILKRYHNVLLIVRNDPKWKGRFSLNEMGSWLYLDDKVMKEFIYDEMRANIEVAYHFPPGAEDVRKAINQVASERSFHPVRDYLNGVVWDGVSRLRTVAAQFLGATDEVSAELLYRWCLSAAARALFPGCKVDTCLILVGAQGCGKSTFFSVLGDGWFSDSYMDIERTDSFLQLHSSWIYEWSELENVMSERRESRLKAFLTSSHDDFRKPYGRSIERSLRSAVIVGTTNQDAFLTDVTGTRRFWVVPVTGLIPIAELAAVRNQIWAEAVARVKNGEQWWLDRELDRQRGLKCEEFATGDSWTDYVSQWVLNQPPLFKIRTSDILKGAVDLEIGKHDRASQMRVSKIMKRMGYSHVLDGPKRTRIWVKNEAE